MAKQTFWITDMHCPACVMRLEGIEDDLPGVLCARANYRKQQIEVEFDAGRLSPTEIVAAIEEMGYTVA